MDLITCTLPLLLRGGITRVAKDGTDSITHQPRMALRSGHNARISVVATVGIDLLN